MLRGTPWEIVIEKDHAYVADEKAGLAVLSVEDPTEPVEIAYLFTTCSHSLDILGNEIYLVGHGRFSVISVYDPSNPLEVGYYDNPGTYKADIVVSGSHAFVANGDAGLTIYEYYGPTVIESPDEDSFSVPKTFSLSQNYPNPFNPTTTITFDIPGETGVKLHTTLTVFDIHGRIVKKLVDEEYEPGTHQVVWDGKNEREQQVSSGV